MKTKKNNVPEKFRPFFKGGHVCIGHRRLDKFTEDLAQARIEEYYKLLENPPIEGEIVFCSDEVNLYGQSQTFHLRFRWRPLEWEECVSRSSARSSQDGRCLSCEGWGCCDCSHTGGY